MSENSEQMVSSVAPGRDLTVDNLEEAKQAVAALIKEKADPIVFDLAGVEQMDTAGLALLLRAYNSQRAEGRRIKIINACDALMLMLDGTRMSDHIMVM